MVGKEVVFMGKLGGGELKKGVVREGMIVRGEKFEG